MLPVCEIRIFSIFRSAWNIRAVSVRSRTGTLTPMNDVIAMTIIKRTSNLPCELPCNAFPQPPMTDDIIQHLSAVHVLEDHVVMMLMDNHLSHPTDVRVMK
jgi:hypothetical protein